MFNSCRNRVKILRATPSKELNETTWYLQKLYSLSHQARNDPVRKQRRETGSPRFVSQPSGPSKNVTLSTIHSKCVLCAVESAPTPGGPRG